MTRDPLKLDIAGASPVAFSGIVAIARSELTSAVSQLDLAANVAPFEVARPGQYAAPGIAIVADGFLRLQHSCENGRSQIATLFMPGDLIESEILSSGPLLLETVTNARLLVARQDRAASLLSRHPSLCRALAELRAIKLGQTRWLADALARLTAEERLVCFLVLATRWMPWQPVTANAGVLTLTLPRPDIANLLATSVETISRVLARLDRDGLIDIRNAQCFHLKDLVALCMAGRMAAGWRSVRFARPNHGAHGRPTDLLPPDGQTDEPEPAGRLRAGVAQASGAGGLRARTFPRKTLSTLAIRQ